MNTALSKDSASGFSMAEICMALAVMAIMAAIAIPTVGEAMRRSDADAAAQIVSQQFSYARSVATSTRQPVLVQFSADDRSVVAAPGTGAQRGPFLLPGRMGFRAAALQPATPDNLGTVIGTGDNQQIWFLDNGAAIDSSGTNTIISGTVFLQHPSGDPETGRAITLLGGTGRIHKWRYDTDTNSWK